MRILGWRWTDEHGTDEQVLHLQCLNGPQMRIKWFIYEYIRCGEVEIRIRIQFPVGVNHDSRTWSTAVATVTINRRSMRHLRSSAGLVRYSTKFDDKMRSKSIDENEKLIHQPSLTFAWVAIQTRGIGNIFFTFANCVCECRGIYTHKTICYFYFPPHSGSIARTHTQFIPNNTIHASRRIHLFDERATAPSLKVDAVAVVSCRKT